ncbi:hypothetical protein [Bradyrhizobium sp. CCBAU 45321]|uniref:hypothetical protein n=1 Tax=Bradyrhizobium sp. CCBAU 45321 TaxID=1641878 RepID=UPI00230330FD|nr:hypothetical protein [Bradyrhizobium sp. CCBAU 45321]
MPSLFLSDAASDDLHNLLRYSLWMELIGPETYLSRLVTLIDLSRRASPTSFYARSLLNAERWSDERPVWPEACESAAFAPVPNAAEGNAGENNELDDLHLIPSSTTGLQHWFFRIGDPDPIPAVPHGHGRQDERKKFDPY